MCGYVFKCVCVCAAVLGLYFPKPDTYACCFHELICLETLHSVNLESVYRDYILFKFVEFFLSEHQQT